MWIVYCEGHRNGDFLDANEEWHNLSDEFDYNQGILNYSVYPFREKYYASQRAEELRKELRKANEGDDVEIKEIFPINYYKIKDWD